MGALVFVFAAAAALVAAGIVLLHRNPVICAFALVVNLLCVAILFLTLGAQFVAALQVIVYAGAIMVLIIFVIMLLGLPRDPQGVRVTSRTAMLATLLGGAGLLAALLRAIASVALRSPAHADSDFGTGEWIARTLFTTYYYPFEVISLVLLAAMAGAILLAKREL